MGMSASQGRLLMLTGRKSDLELQGQVINQRIMQLAQRTVKFTEDYTRAIGNKKIVVFNASGDEASWADLASNPELLKGHYDVVNKDGNVVNIASPQRALKQREATIKYSQTLNELENSIRRPGMNIFARVSAYQNYYIGVAEAAKEYQATLVQIDKDYPQGQSYTNAQVQQNFASGAWQLRPAGDANAEKVHYGTEHTATLREVLDESDDAVALATYEGNMAKIQQSEKYLELQLKNIDTEHKAIDTEIDTVKKVLQKNIQRSYKTFAG